MADEDLMGFIIRVKMPGFPPDDYVVISNDAEQALFDLSNKIRTTSQIVYVRQVLTDSLAQFDGIKAGMITKL